jgi:hypothetical protein
MNVTYDRIGEMAIKNKPLKWFMKNGRFKI